MQSVEVESLDPRFAVFRFGAWELHRSAHGSFWLHDSDKREHEWLTNANQIGLELRRLRVRSDKAERRKVEA